MKRLILPLSCLVLLTGVLQSCGGLKVKPPRKKLPALTETSSEGWEAAQNGSGRSMDNTHRSGEPAYLLSDTIVGGQSLYALQLPGAAYDSVTLNLMRAYEPMIGTAFDLLEKYGKKGLVIDLRMDEGPITQSTYSAQTMDGRSVTLILLWDGHSAGRAGTLVNELLHVSGISTHLVSERSNGPTGKIDCFQDNHPIGFDR